MSVVPRDKPHAPRLCSLMIPPERDSWKKLGWRREGMSPLRRAKGCSEVTRMPTRCSISSSVPEIELTTLQCSICPKTSDRMRIWHARVKGTVKEATQPSTPGEALHS